MNRYDVPAIDAEAVAGHRLDRRCNYAVIDGEVCRLATWTQACSGCVYGNDDRGSGCPECGHTGKHRVRMYLPLKAFEDHQ